MDKITHEVRLSQWKALIEQCQARPKGMTAKQWLEDNGISNKQYYYWLRRVRKEAYDQKFAVGTLPAKGSGSMVSEDISFAEIPVAPETGKLQSDSSFLPAAVIRTQSMEIALSNSASGKLISSIMKEAVHAG